MSSLGTSSYAPTADDRRLHYVSRGEGRPTVVFESGMGASRSSWGAVLPKVAEHTRTVAYDRAGLGQSPPAPAPRPLDALVDDLSALLDQLGEGPFVLVGHSWGGPIARVLASRRPDDVAGLVLVDQSDEGCSLFFDGSTRTQTTMAKLYPFAAKVGVMRLVMRQTRKYLPADVAADMEREDSTVETARTMQAELTDFVGDLARLRDHPQPLPDVPVTLISGTKVPKVQKAQRAGIIDAHRERAESLPQGRHVSAGKSGHLVMLSEPDLVTTEILRIVDHVRRA